MLVKTADGCTDPDKLRTGDGGLQYEVVLKEAKTKRMPRPKSAPATRNYSKEDIQRKLKVIYDIL